MACRNLWRLLSSARIVAALLFRPIQRLPLERDVRILVRHGKHGDQYWLADTPERLEAALRRLFTELDELGCYAEDETQSLMLAKAREGNARCIRYILESRKDREYEDWDMKKACDPCTD